MQNNETREHKQALKEETTNSGQAAKRSPQVDRMVVDVHRLSLCCCASPTQQSHRFPNRQSKQDARATGDMNNYQKHV
jgi:hypothetical protein